MANEPPIYVTIEEHTLKALLSALDECADDLEAHFDVMWPARDEYPYMQRKYDRDMAVVRRAREIINDVRQGRMRND